MTNALAAYDAIPRTKKRLLDATVGLVLEQGFNATRVDQICAAAEVTKGGFFHYFKSKEEVGLEAMKLFSCMGDDIYTRAIASAPADPLEQLHSLFDQMIGMAENSEKPLICMIGMMAQELSVTNDRVRQAALKYLTRWNDMVCTLLEKAKKAHPTTRELNVEQIAWMMNSLWQGSILIGKVRSDQSVIVSNLSHLRDYIDSFFDVPPRR